MIHYAFYAGPLKSLDVLRPHEFTFYDDHIQTVWRDAKIQLINLLDWDKEAIHINSRSINQSLLTIQKAIEPSVVTPLAAISQTIYIKENQDGTKEHYTLFLIAGDSRESIAKTISGYKDRTPAPVTEIQAIPYYTLFL